MTGLARQVFELGDIVHGEALLVWRRQARRVRRLISPGDGGDRRGEVADA